jgi:hypothetical protein
MIAVGAAIAAAKNNELMYRPMWCMKQSSKTEIPGFRILVAVTIYPWHGDVCSVQHTCENKDSPEISVSSICLTIRQIPNLSISLQASADMNVTHFAQNPNSRYARLVPSNRKVAERCAKSGGKNRDTPRSAGSSSHV